MFGHHTPRPAKRSNSEPEEFSYKFALTFILINSPSIEAPSIPSHPSIFSLTTSFSGSCPATRSCLSVCPKSDRKVQSKFAFSLFLWLSISGLLNWHCYVGAAAAASEQRRSQPPRNINTVQSEWMHAKRRIGLYFNLFLGH